MTDYETAQVIARCANRLLEPETWTAADEDRWAVECEAKAIKDSYLQIEADHYAECPMAIAARDQRKSTLCVCEMLEVAKASVEEHDI